MSNTNEIIVLDSDPRSLEPADLVLRARGQDLTTVDGKPVPPAAHPYLAYLTHYENKDSRATMERALDDACAVLGSECTGAQFPWWFLRRTHVQVLRAQLAAEYAPATANRILTAVRGVLKECFRADVISANDYNHAIDIEAVKGSRELAGRALEKEEIDRMLAACDPGDPLGTRNRAVIGVLTHVGLRRKEATRLDLSSYNRSTLHIIGKGNKERFVHVNEMLASMLEAWMMFRGKDPGPLFFKATPQGKIVSGLRLSYSGMQYAVLDIARRVGVEDVSLHDFRRTLISDLLDDGVDIATAAKIVGHASTDTTAKYDRRGERAARDALERRGNKWSKKKEIDNT